MIIQTGQRTDIPAFYSKWFANRLREGFVYVRNPYNRDYITRYCLDPSVVDLIAFCTKNPAPFFPYMNLLEPYGQYWFVTITPYGRDIEPRVPDKHQVIRDFNSLSRMVGNDRICWRYDPILVNERYTLEYHLKAFSQMAALMEGSTKTCVISFIDLYAKVLKNFPDVHSVRREDMEYLAKEIVAIAGEHGMTVKSCGEGNWLKVYGIDTSGCMTYSVYEKALGKKLNFPRGKEARKECACYLSGDIGAYNSCMHLCRYCYANVEADTVRQNFALHDPASPLLIGRVTTHDVIHEAKQKSFIDNQLSLPFC